MVKIDFINVIRSGNRIFCSYRAGNSVTTFDTYDFDLYDIIHHIYDIEKDKKLKDLQVNLTEFVNDEGDPYE